MDPRLADEDPFSANDKVDLKRRSWAVPKATHRAATRPENLNIRSDLEQKLSLTFHPEKLTEFTYTNPFFGDKELQRKVQRQTPFHPLSIFFQDQTNTTWFVSQESDVKAPEAVLKPEVGEVTEVPEKNLEDYKNRFHSETTDLKKVIIELNLTTKRIVEGGQFPLMQLDISIQNSKWDRFRYDFTGVQYADGWPSSVLDVIVPRSSLAALAFHFLLYSPNSPFPQSKFSLDIWDLSQYQNAKDTTLQETLISGLPNFCPTLSSVSLHHLPGQKVENNNTLGEFWSVYVIDPELTGAMAFSFDQGRPMVSSAYLCCLLLTQTRKSVRCHVGGREERRQVLLYLWRTGINPPEPF